MNKVLTYLVKEKHIANKIVGMAKEIEYCEKRNALWSRLMDVRKRTRQFSEIDNVQDYYATLELEYNNSHNKSPEEMFLLVCEDEYRILSEKYRIKYIKNERELIKKVVDYFNVLDTTNEIDDIKTIMEDFLLFCLKNKYFILVHLSLTESILAQILICEDLDNNISHKLGDLFVKVKQMCSS